MEEDDTHNHKPQRLTMFNEPKRNQQPHRHQNRHNRQPILARPPKRQQETHAQHNTRDFARHDVESREYQ
jgi:hypothetical protein